MTIGKNAQFSWISLQGEKIYLFWYCQSWTPNFLTHWFTHTFKKRQ